MTGTTVNVKVPLSHFSGEPCENEKPPDIVASQFMGHSSVCHVH